jgi:sugar O-acyltransferase (sialic acid O-acetyltransferase NeuD family)
MTRPLILIAASGLARETVVAARAQGAYDVVGFVDDDASQWGSSWEGVPVLGGLDLVMERTDTAVVLCAGKGASRAAIAARLADSGFDPSRYGTVLHPSVDVPDFCSIGVGSIVLAGTVLTTSVIVGQHAVVMPHVTLTHDNVIENYVTIAAGVALGGWVHVGERSYLGMSSSVRERVRIGPDVVVGMGAVVIGDVPAGQTVVGNPARQLNSRAVHT